MKAKRKDINRYNHERNKSEEQDKNFETLKRTTGAKPFQLSKVRSQKRSSIELVNKANVDPTHHRHRTRDEQQQCQRDVYLDLDLIIKKKMIVDNQFSQVLESQRKNIIYDELKGEMTLDKPGMIHLDIKRIKAEGCLDDNQEVPFDDLLEEGRKTQYKKRTKCLCCQHMNCYLTQAIIDHKTTTNLFFHHAPDQASNPEQKDSNLDHKQEFALKIQLQNVKEKVLKSPFSFTNLKWRTKSQIFQIDKWKQKYGKSNNTTTVKKTHSLAKLTYQNQVRLEEKVNQCSKTKTQNALAELEKKLFPSITHTLDNQIFKNSSYQAHKMERPQPSKQITKTEEDTLISLDKYKTFKIKQRTPEIQRQQKYIKKRKQSETMKQKQQLMEKEYREEYKSNQQKNNSSDKTEGLNISLQKEKQSLEKGQFFKKKKKGYKFPLIQGSSIDTSRKVDSDNKRSRLFHKNTISPHTWRQKLPRKKAYFEKVMEDIPQRWQYGESRDSSRQVDFYLKIKRQQQEKDKREKQLMEEQLRYLEEKLQSHYTTESKKIKENQIFSK